MSCPNRASALLVLPLGFAAALAMAPPALADSGRLEADLQALFAGEGSLEIGEISSALLRSRLTAEDLRFESHDGERLLIVRYIVRGDYDRPDEVTLEGIRLEAFLDEPAVLELERLAVSDPGRAVPPDDDEALLEQWLSRLTLSGLSLRDRKSTRLNSSHVRI